MTSREPLRTRPAELHWMQTPSNTWTGSVILLGHHIVDAERRHRAIPKSLRPFCRVNSVTVGLRPMFRLSFVAPSKSGQRHSDYDTLDKAKTAGARWAGRRFRVVVEEDRTDR